MIEANRGYEEHNDVLVAYWEVDKVELKAMVGVGITRHTSHHWQLRRSKTVDIHCCFSQRNPIKSEKNWTTWEQSPLLFNVLSLIIKYFVSCNRGSTEKTNTYEDKILLAKALTARRTDNRALIGQSGDSNTASWPTISTDKFLLFDSWRPLWWMRIFSVVVAVYQHRTA